MRRPLFALALAGILGLAMACEFLGWGLYPTELQNVDRRLDLADLVLSQTGFELDHVMGTAVLRADPSLPYHLLVLCSLKNFGPNTVFFLDPKTLAFESCFSDNNANLPIAIAYDTWPQPSGIGFTAGALRIDHLATTSLAGSPSSNDAGIVLQPTLTNNLVLWSSSGSIGLSAFSPGWALLGGPYGKPAISGNYGLELRTAANVPSSTSVLLLLMDTNARKGLLVGFANPEDLVTAITSVPITDLQTSGLVTKFLIFGHDIKDVWLTDKEILAYEDYDKGKLVRYSLADGSELDSRSFNTQDIQGLSFSSATSRWYYWDKVRKEFLSLRTWW